MTKVNIGGKWQQWQGIETLSLLKAASSNNKVYAKRGDNKKKLQRDIFGNANF